MPHKPIFISFYFTIWILSVNFCRNCFIKSTPVGGGVRPRPRVPRGRDGDAHHRQHHRRILPHRIRGQFFAISPRGNFLFDQSPSQFFYLISPKSII
jgi:hypothetical protein